MDRKGFTLLEVLIAMALLSITFLWLLKAANQSVDMASRSKFITTSTLLAQQRIAEVMGDDARLPRDDKGDFGEDFPGYRYEEEIEPTPLQGYYKYTLTVRWGEKGNLETYFVTFLSSK